MKTNSFRCCICGKIDFGYGNNPEPVCMKPSTRCCDVCNMTKVIPKRLNALNLNPLSKVVK